MISELIEKDSRELQSVQVPALSGSEGCSPKMPVQRVRMITVHEVLFRSFRFAMIRRKALLPFGKDLQKSSAFFRIAAKDLEDPAF